MDSQCIGALLIWVGGFFFGCAAMRIYLLNKYRVLIGYYEASKAFEAAKTKKVIDIETR